MTDPKALEELDLASRAIERARALLAGEGPVLSSGEGNNARPSSSPSMRENFTLAGYLEGHLIARTLFASRAVAFSPQPHWDQDPNPLRGKCLDDAWDIVRALGARGMLSSPSPAVRDVTLEALKLENEDLKAFIRGIGINCQRAAETLSQVASSALHPSVAEGRQPRDEKI